MLLSFSLQVPPKVLAACPGAPRCSRKFWKLSCRGVKGHSASGEAPDWGLLSQQRLWRGEWLPQRNGSSHPCGEKQPLKTRCSGVHSTDPRMATGGVQPGQLLPDQSHPARSPGLCARHLVLSSIQILALDAPVRTTVLQIYSDEKFVSIPGRIAGSQ